MRTSALVVTALVLSLAGTASAQAPATPPTLPEGPRIVVSYVEVAPASDKEAVALLRAYRDATRKDAGNARADVFQQNGRPGHFLVVEEWRDEGTWKAHRSAPHVTQFHEKVAPLRLSPYDERGHAGLETAANSGASSGTVFVATHVDVIGAGAAKARELLRTLAVASRKEPGNIRFDALQALRPNHFTVIETWRDERTRETHLSQPHTKAFRDGLYQLSVEGAPYDERLYRVIP
jgi:quinol monooxygenase YgiN